MRITNQNMLTWQRSMGQRCSIVLWFSLALLYALLLHGERAVHIVQFVIEAAGIADGVAFIVASPKRRRVGLTVGADDATATIVWRGCCFWLLALWYMANRLRTAIAGAIWTIGPVRALANEGYLAGLALDLLQCERCGGRGTARRHGGVVVANAASWRPMTTAHIGRGVVINNLRRIIRLKVGQGI